MRHVTTYLFISAGTCLLGILFFCFYHEILIFRPPGSFSFYSKPASEITTGKKAVIVYYWHNNCWQSESRDLIWGQSKADNIYQLVINWLTTLHEEEVISKRVFVQSVIISPTDSLAYVSFDRSPLPKEQSTFEKLMLMEGLLRTVRKNGISVQKIHFFVNHQPIADPHLDFSNPWPIDGFLNHNR